MKNTIIAKRCFDIYENNDVLKVEVFLFQPIPDDDDYKCCYEIKWPNSTRSAYAIGIDEIQALILAIKMLGVDIYSSSAAKEKRLVWLEEGKGFGLLLPHNLQNLYQGDDKKM